MPPFLTNKSKITSYFTLFLLIISQLPSISQGTLEDYRRSETLKNKLKDKVYNAPNQVNWSKSGKIAWYTIQTPRGKEFISVFPQTKTRQVAFNHESLAEQLNRLAKTTAKPFNLPFNFINFVKEDQEIEFSTEGFVWTYALATNSLHKKEPIRNEPQRYWAAAQSDQPDKPIFSPDSLWTCYVKNFNVYIRSVKTNKELQLSFDGAEGEYYSGFVQWAPDSKKLVANKIRPNQKHLIYFVRSSPEDQLQPKLESREYLKPGDALPIRQPHLFLIEEQKNIPIDDALFNQQYSLSRMDWRKDSRAFTFEYNQRGHQIYRVLEVSASNGAIRPLDRKSVV